MHGSRRPSASPSDSMRSTGIDRRGVLAIAAAFGVAPAAALAALAKGEDLYIAARRRAGRFEVAVFDARGEDRLVVPLEARGHSFAVSGDRTYAVAFARQPGRFAVNIDLSGRTRPQIVAAEPDRHFFGHGAFADRGRLLVATENDYDGERGVLGIYDTGDGLKRIGEFASGGLDPHEIVTMPDGRTLCVANGGLLTHPDYGKLPLNRDSMAPSLAYVDARTGDILERVALDPVFHQLAFHHLAVDASGAVWVGGQYHGPPDDRPPLVGRHRRGEPIEMVPGPPEILRRLDNYIGAVAVDASGTIVATSSPKGGAVAYWDAASGDCLGMTELRDACGVAGTGATSHFRLASGTGHMIDADMDAGVRVVTPPSESLSWDNHLRRF